MRRLLLITAAVAAAIAALAPAAAVAARPVYWDTIGAEQHLTVGRFAARYDVRDATCVGSGPSRKHYGVDTFRTFDCSVLGRDLDKEPRQLVVRVTGAGSFTVRWLKQQTCTRYAAVVRARVASDPRTSQATSRSDCQPAARDVYKTRGVAG
jgi:opacity protein-like surface antigen